jgi:hypothetical protein
LSVACFDTGELLYPEHLFIDAVFIDILIDGGSVSQSFNTKVGQVQI